MSVLAVVVTTTLPRDLRVNDHKVLVTALREDLGETVRIRSYRAPTLTLELPEPRARAEEVLHLFLDAHRTEWWTC
jgi:hypothetical protein